MISFSTQGNPQELAMFEDILKQFEAKNPKVKVERKFDPSLTSVDGPYVAAFNDFLRRELKFEIDLVYERLARVWPWSFLRPTPVVASRSIRCARVSSVRKCA